MGKSGTRNPLAAPMLAWLTPEVLAQWEEEEAKLRAETVDQIERTYRNAVIVLGQEKADQVWKKAAAIRPLHDEGLGPVEIGKRLGISPTSLWRVVTAAQGAQLA